MRGDDRKIDRAIQAGERNQRAKEFVQNWCAHARVVKMGGTGLIEVQTGLPIGHHCLECDYAEARGLGTWLIEDAAVDFYDRNCTTCTHRKPVRLPNIIEFVRVRDERRRRVEAEKERLAKEVANAFAARQEVRHRLRRELAPVHATVIDQLETLDQERSVQACDALVNMATLAPDLFTTPIVEHIFLLLESRERWFDRAGLQLLQELRLNPARLTRCALLCLADHNAVDIAAAIVESNAECIDTDELIAKALPSLVFHADPLRTFGPEAPVSVPGPLTAVYRTHTAAVDAAIGQLLRASEVLEVQAACRAIIVLSEHGAPIAPRFTASVATKLAYADQLDSGQSFSDKIADAEHDMRRALAKAIEQAPEETDAMLVRRIEATSNEAQARLYSAYREVLRVPWRRKAPVVITPAHTTALKRLLSAATTGNDFNDEVIHEIQSAFHSAPAEFEELARREMESLLGAALILDDRLKGIDAPSALVDPHPQASLEKLNRRQALAALQMSLIRWAANAAVGDRYATTQYVALLSNIPAERESLRATMLEAASVMTASPDGLATVLPMLYSAMVGTSTMMRAAGAALLKDMESSRRADC